MVGAGMAGGWLTQRPKGLYLLSQGLAQSLASKSVSKAALSSRSNPLEFATLEFATAQITE